MAFDPRIHDPDYPDPIVEEIRAIKRKLAAECNYDLDRMFEELRHKEETSGRTYVSCPPRSDEAVGIPPLDIASGNQTSQPAK